jgi:hypothetical protein
LWRGLRKRLQPEHEKVRESLAITFEFLRPADSGKILLMKKSFKDAGLPTAQSIIEKLHTMGRKAFPEKYGLEE